MSRYVKFLVALLGGISSWGVTVASDGTIDLVELFGLLAVLATAMGVLALPNTAPDGGTGDPDISEADAGAGELRTILLLAAGTLLGLVLFYAFVLEHVR